MIIANCDLCITLALYESRNQTINRRDEQTLHIAPVARDRDW